MPGWQGFHWLNVIVWWSMRCWGRRHEMKSWFFGHACWNIIKVSNLRCEYYPSLHVSTQKESLAKNTGPNKTDETNVLTCVWWQAMARLKRQVGSHPIDLPCFTDYSLTLDLLIEKKGGGGEGELTQQYHTFCTQICNGWGNNRHFKPSQKRLVGNSGLKTYGGQLWMAKTCPWKP